MRNNMTPPSFEPWTAEDDATILKTKEMDVNLSDTAYGRQIALEKKNANLAVNHMNEEELEELERKILIAKAANMGTNNMHV